MSNSAHNEILAVTQKLLDCIGKRDWETYQALCDPTLTCFEPEACGHLVEGLNFHRFYFDLGGSPGTSNNTIVSPHVRMLGDDAAVISYVRLVQRAGADGKASTSRGEESRIWQRQNNQWRHVHFHRSAP